MHTHILKPTSVMSLVSTFPSVLQNENTSSANQRSYWMQSSLQWQEGRCTTSKEQQPPELLSAPCWPPFHKGCIYETKLTYSNNRREGRGQGKQEGRDGYSEVGGEGGPTATTAVPTRILRTFRWSNLTRCSNMKETIVSSLSYMVM